MRIFSMSESPNFPPLETLLPMEKSWALQVEREEENACLKGKKNLPHRNSESVRHICKQLNTGSTEHSHRSYEREYELCSKRASTSIDSKPYRNDMHHDSARHLDETSTPWWYTSSSRCYAPSSHIRSSDSSLPVEQRASHQSGALHETRRFDKHRTTGDPFACRQHSILLKDGIVGTTRAVKPSKNTGERRENHFACLNGKAEMTPDYETSKKHEAHADELSRNQEHQELDEYKYKYQPSLNKRSRYRDSVKCGFSECGSWHWYGNQEGHHEHWQGVDERRKGAKCRRTSDSEMGQHKKRVHTRLGSKEKPRVANDEHAFAEAVIITGNASMQGVSILESRRIDEPEAKNDDSMVEKQYEMLASLLFDDLQGMDKDVDATLAGDGSDCEFSGSIFDDDLKTSVDIDVCSTKYPNCNSKKTSKVKSSASDHAVKSQTACSPSCLKQFPSVLIDVTNKFEIYSSPGVKGEFQEDDAHRLSQRQRQIDFGKNTLGYERYIELIPRIKRKAKDPQTPNPKQVCSKRSWDGQIRKWRRLLHVYDPPSEDGEEIAEDFSILKLHRPNLQGKGHDAKEEGSTDIRFAEADESKSSVAVPADDANLTIYDDWMES